MHDFVSVDTPTNRSGGIFASPRTARRGKSYTRSTSVSRLGMPCRDEYSDSFVSESGKRDRGLLDITFRFRHRRYQLCLERSGTGLDLT